MAYSLAVFITWGAFLVDGNHLTNWMSIGEKTAETGLAPPPPAIVGGLNTHKVFEGASYPRLFLGSHLMRSFPWSKAMRAQPEATSTLATTSHLMKLFSIRCGFC